MLWTAGVWSPMSNPSVFGSERYSITATLCFVLVIVLVHQTNPTTRTAALSTRTSTNPKTGSAGAASAKWATPSLHEKRIQTNHHPPNLQPVRSAIASWNGYRRHIRKILFVLLQRLPAGIYDLNGSHGFAKSRNLPRNRFVQAMPGQRHYSQFRRRTIRGT